VLDAAAELEVLVTTPLPLEVLEATDELDDAAAELELEVLVLAAAEEVDEAANVTQEHAELTAATSLLQLPKSVGIAATSVVVLARNSGQKV
jgi:hypothetical protein